MEPDDYCVGACRLLLQPTGTESGFIGSEPGVSGVICHGPNRTRS